MSDELDPLLLRLFSQRREPLADQEFMVTLLHRIQRKQRAAALRQAAVIAALLLLVAWNLPDLLRATASAVQSLSAQTETYAPLMLSPLGWALSMVVGFAVILRMTPRRG